MVICYSKNGNLRHIFKVNFSLLFLFLKLSVMPIFLQLKIFFFSISGKVGNFPNIPMSKNLKSKNLNLWFLTNVYAIHSITLT